MRRKNELTEINRTNLQVEDVRSRYQKPISENEIRERAQRIAAEIVKEVVARRKTSRNASDGRPI